MTRRRLAWVIISGTVACIVVLLIANDGLRLWLVSRGLSSKDAQEVIYSRRNEDRPYVTGRVCRRSGEPVGTWYEHLWKGGPVVRAVHFAQPGKVIGRTYWDSRGRLAFQEQWSEGVEPMDLVEADSAPWSYTHWDLVSRVEGPWSWNVQDRAASSPTWSGGKSIYIPDFRLGDIELEDSTFSSSFLWRTGMVSASLARARFTDASLYEVNLSGADLRNVTMQDCSLTSCSFDRANFRESILRVTDRRGGYEEAKFDDADLRDCEFQESAFWNASFTGCRFDGAVLSRVQFGGADLRQATGLTTTVLMEGASWDESTAMPEDLAAALPSSHEAP